MTEEVTDGEVRVEEVVVRGKGMSGVPEEEVRLEVAVTSGGVAGEGSESLRGLGWGLLVLALGLLSGSAFVWGRRRRGRSRRGGGRGSSLGVPSCSASTVSILIFITALKLNKISPAGWR